MINLIIFVITLFLAKILFASELILPKHQPKIEEFTKNRPFVSQIRLVPDNDKNKFATDMCWLAMKAGRRYGPFAKVY